MAELNPAFAIVQDGSQSGQILDEINPGDTLTGKNGIQVFGFKDSSGNAVTPQLDSSGRVPVTFEGSGLCQNIKGTLVGTTTESTVASAVLTNGKKIMDFEIMISCFRSALFRLVVIQDVGGADTEVELLPEMRVGSAKTIEAFRKACKEYTAPASLVNELRLVAKNSSATSEMSGDVDFKQEP